MSLVFSYKAPRRRPVDWLSKAFGEAVRDRREALGMRQEELARRADLGELAANDIELGRADPSRLRLATLYAIARALEIHPAELLPVDQIGKLG